MSDTTRDKRAEKLKIFNDEWDKAHPINRKGTFNLWEKDLNAAGMSSWEIGKLFSRPWKKQRDFAAKSKRRWEKMATQTGDWSHYRRRSLRFDFWYWD